jgi:hypothetical protein
MSCLGYLLRKEELMPQIVGGVLREDFIRVAEEIFARYIAMPDNPKPDRVGAYLSVFDKSQQKILLVLELGSCKAEMADRWFHYSLEKLERLWGNRSKGHITSWQSRDKGMFKYGGAITAPDDSQGLKEGHKLIGSIAGLTDHGEEAILLVIWLKFSWLAMEDAKKIAQISGNHLFQVLLKNCKDLFDAKPVQDKI